MCSFISLPGVAKIVRRVPDVYTLPYSDSTNSLLLRADVLLKVR